MLAHRYADLYRSAHGLGTTIYSPLASGVLTGKYNNGIPPESRFTVESYQYASLSMVISNAFAALLCKSFHLKCSRPVHPTAASCIAKEEYCYVCTLLLLCFSV
jgi:hypothetical protein